MEFNFYWNFPRIGKVIHFRFCIPLAVGTRAKVRDKIEKGKQWHVTEVMSLMCPDSTRYLLCCLNVSKNQPFSYHWAGAQHVHRPDRGQGHAV